LPKRFFRDLVAAFAVARMEAAGEDAKLAEWVGDQAAADHHASRADFWHRVQCRADGTPVPKRVVPKALPPIAAYEPTRLSNPIVFVLVILSTLFVISMAMPFLLPKPGAHVAEAVQ